MSKIVYLLGAGASAQAMPLVKDFNLRLKIFHDFFHHAFHPNYNKENKDFLDSIEQLHNNATNHYSIDTLAKKYYLTGSSEYDKLKALLICFFAFESFTFSETKRTIQAWSTIASSHKKNKEYSLAINACEKTIDLRYDALLAALIKSPSDLSIPTDISFISWNYDDQLEFAANNIVTACNHGGKEIRALIHPIDSKGGKVSKNTNLIKLNGSYLPDISMFETKKDEIFIQFFKERSITDDNLAVWPQLYKRLIEQPELLKMNFAWEHDPKKDNRIAKAKELIKAATELVVIGYSFPNYNVEIDQMIFGGNKNYTNVYIEDTADHYEGIVERLEYLGLSTTSFNKDSKKLKNHRDLNTFCLPPSFYGIQWKRPKSFLL